VSRGNEARDCSTGRGCLDIRGIEESESKEAIAEYVRDKAGLKGVGGTVHILVETASRH